MTNPKIKGYHKNVILYNVMLENLRNLARIMLALNRLYPKQFYKKRIQLWLEKYANNCDEMDRLDEADAYDFKMAQWCEECGIDTAWCIAFVKHQGAREYRSSGEQHKAGTGADLHGVRCR